MKSNLVGNLANQKYEATRNMERHVMITSGQIQATWETSRWRRQQNEYNFHKQKGRMVEAERRINLDNNFLNERINEIVTEDRKTGTHEYAPGWRVGRVGTCIDCYPSQSHHLTSRNMNKAQAQARAFAKTLVHKSNVQVHKFLQRAKSSYQKKDHAEFYKRNRVVYKIFMDRTPVTSLHLGLVALAKRNMAKRQKVAENQRESPSRPGSAPQQQPGAQRPAGLPPLSPAQRRNDMMRRSKDSKDEVVEVVKGIQNMDDLFAAKEIIRGIRNRQNPWDGATNDNYYNSQRNDTAVRKAYSIYQEPSPHEPVRQARPKTAADRAASTRYLNDRCPSILEVSAQMQKEADAIAAAAAARRRTGRPQSHNGATGYAYSPSLQPSADRFTSADGSQLYQASTTRTASLDGSVQIDRNDESDDQIRRLRKLQALRKNVSFVEDIAVVEYNDRHEVVGITMAPPVNVEGDLSRRGSVDIVSESQGQLSVQANRMATAADQSSQPTAVQTAVRAEHPLSTQSLGPLTSGGRPPHPMRTSVDASTFRDVSHPLGFVYEEHLTGGQLSGLTTNRNSVEYQGVVDIADNGEDLELNVEEILHALKPHDEFLLDCRLDISSRFPFFVRKDGLISSVLEIEDFPLTFRDHQGKEVGQRPHRVEVMIYDVGYILSGGAQSSNMFNLPADFEAQQRREDQEISGPNSPPLPHLDTGEGHQGETAHDSYSDLRSFFSGEPMATHAPNSKIRVSRSQQRLSMTLASLRNHPVGLPTSVGILVAVRVILNDGSPGEPPSPLPMDQDGAVQDLQGFVFLSLRQLMDRHKAFPRDAAILTILHEMQTFAYPYSGVDAQNLAVIREIHKQLLASNIPMHSSFSGGRYSLMSPGRSMIPQSMFSMLPKPLPGTAGTDSGVAGKRVLSAGDKHRKKGASNSSNKAGNSGPPSPLKQALMGSRSTTSVSKGNPVNVPALEIAEDDDDEHVYTIDEFDDLQSHATSSFAGQRILTIDEGHRHAVIYPCLLDMCDSEAIDSLIQPILRSLRITVQMNETQTVPPKPSPTLHRLSSRRMQRGTSSGMHTPVSRPAEEDKPDDHWQVHVRCLTTQ